MFAMPQTKNLFLPGFRPDGVTPRTLVSLPGYWDNQGAAQRVGGRGDAYLPELLRLGRGVDPLGVGTVVMIDSVDVRTGAVLERTITHNVVTDVGAAAMLSIFTGTAASVAQYLALDTNGATSTLTGAIAAAADLTTLNASAGMAVNAKGSQAAVTGNKAASYISNTTSVPCTSGAVGSADPVTGGGIVLDYGGSTQEWFSGAATQGSATNVKASAGVAHAAHSVGAWVVANPQVTDGPSSLPSSAIIYNSTASTNAATGTAVPATVLSTGGNSGKGNRQAQFVATFNTSSTAGNYNQLYVVTASTIAALNAASKFYTHLSFADQALSSTVQIQVTYSLLI